MGLDLEMSIAKRMSQSNGYEDLKGLSYMPFAALHQFPMGNYLKYFRQLTGTKIRKGLRKNRISTCNHFWEQLQPQTCNSRSCSICLSLRASGRPARDTCQCYERIQRWCNAHIAPTILAERKAGAF